MRVFSLLAVFVPRLALATNGLANPGFEVDDSTWSWYLSNPQFAGRVSSPTDGVTAHEGSFQDKIACAGTCYATTYQIISGATYRGGAGTLSAWVYSSIAVSSNDGGKNLSAKVAAYDASNTLLARNDIAIAGNYAAGADWDKTQVQSISAGTWTQVTLNVRSVLDGKLGANLSKVDRVVVGFHAEFANSTATVFWDDASWPMRTAGPLTATPKPGSFEPPQSVVLTCGSPAPIIRYTVDGSTPTTSSPIYNAPIVVSATGTTTVKAFCQSNGVPDSEVSSFSYTLRGNGLANPGFEVNDSTWTWLNSGAQVVARVASPTEGINAHGGSFQTEMKCTSACAGNVYQVISGNTYRGGVGTLAFSIYSAGNIAGNSTNQVVYVSVIARNASDTILARDDIAVAGNYSVANDWDKAQVQTINGGMWTPIALNVRSVLDTKLGANLAAVDKVAVLLRMGAAAGANTTVFWDDVSWDLLAAAPVTASPAAGSFTSAQNVTLACASPSPTIRYTIDGSAPTGSSPVYASPIAITHPGTITVKAICQSPGYSNSPVSAFAYTLNLTAAAPAATPGAGSYGSPQYISLSCSTPSPTIRYTLDGSTPNGGSRVYSAPFQLYASATVNAICQSPGYVDSAVSSFAYSLPTGLCPFGSTCDDGVPCTYNDTCDVLGQCVGTPLICLSDTCTTRTCNGTATCSVTYAPAGTACNDGSACTHDDRCNGAGGCAGTPVSCAAAGPCQTIQCDGTSWCSVSMLPSGTACSPAQGVCGQVCDGVSPHCQPAE